MRKLLPFVLLVCACAFTGCEDSRAKRATHLLEVKTEQAEKEVDEAKTDAEARQVAKDYFKTATPMVKAINDYLHGREPRTDEPK